MLGAGVQDALQLQLAQPALLHDLQRQRVPQRVGALRQPDRAAVPQRERVNNNGYRVSSFTEMQGERISTCGNITSSSVCIL